MSIGGELQHMVQKSPPIIDDIYHRAKERLGKAQESLPLKPIPPGTDPPGTSREALQELAAAQAYLDAVLDRQSPDDIAYKCNDDHKYCSFIVFSNDSAPTQPLYCKRCNSALRRLKLVNGVWC